MNERVITTIFAPEIIEQRRTVLHERVDRLVQIPHVQPVGEFTLFAAYWIIFAAGVVYDSVTRHDQPVEIAASPQTVNNHQIDKNSD